MYNDGAFTRRHGPRLHERVALLNFVPRNPHGEPGSQRQSDEAVPDFT
jgi:hypothetical protein